MKFDIDDDNNVRIDDVVTPGFDVVEDVATEPSVKISTSAIILTEPDPSRNVRGGASRTTTLNYGGIDNQLFEVATAEELGANLEGYILQDIQRRVIFAQMPVAGYLVVERVPVAIESSFVRGVFLTLPSFSE